MCTILVSVGVIVGAGAGAWIHQYLLKRNPALLARLSAKARALGARF